MHPKAASGWAGSVFAGSHPAHGVLVVLSLWVAPAAVAETEPASGTAAKRVSLDLTLANMGVGIGNSGHIDGLRLNVRDDRPFTTHGVHVTLMPPAERARGGTVAGLALGVPFTGAEELDGVAVGMAIETHRVWNGLGVGALGFYGAGQLHGVFVGGTVGITRGDIAGFSIAGVKRRYVQSAPPSAKPTTAQPPAQRLSLGAVCLHSNGAAWFRDWRPPDRRWSPDSCRRARCSARTRSTPAGFHRGYRPSRRPLGNRSPRSRSPDHQLAFRRASPSHGCRRIRNPAGKRRGSVAIGRVLRFSLYIAHRRGTH